jgi:hypothetical protein
MVEFTGMVHPLLATSEFHGAALTALIAVFDDVCRELNLNTDDDTAVVAEVVLNAHAKEMPIRLTCASVCVMHEQWSEFEGLAAEADCSWPGALCLIETAIQGGRESLHNGAFVTPGITTQGHSASKTRVNALMHRQPRATEHPLALKIASRSDQRSGVRGATVSFIGRGT